MSQSSPDDAALLESALEGDQQAFGSLVLRYQDRLFNTMLRVLTSTEDARDVTQNAFVQAFLKLESFRGDSKFYTWLYRIAMNLALSHMRRRKSVVSIEHARETSAMEVEDRNPLPQDRLVGDERVRLVQQALSQLGDQSRQILVLREIEDCSYETIAEILELPIGTVRSRLFRARMQLKEQLQALLAQELELDK